MTKLTVEREVSSVGDWEPYDAKMSYRLVDRRYTSTLYADEWCWVDGEPQIVCGTNKHTDEPVMVEWSDEFDGWVEVKNNG